MYAQKKKLEEQNFGRKTQSEVGKFEGGFIPTGQGTKSDEEMQKDTQIASDSQPITVTTRKKLVRPSEYKDKLEAMLQKHVNPFVERERAKFERRNLSDEDQ